MNLLEPQDTPRTRVYAHASPGPRELKYYENHPGFAKNAVFIHVGHIVFPNPYRNTGVAGSFWCILFPERFLKETRGINYSQLVASSIRAFPGLLRLRPLS